MSTIKVNKLEQRSGCTATVGGGAGKTVTVDATTVTIGRCGGSVSLASGASQSGFGTPSSSVLWCTTAKTSPFTAASKVGYFVNTTGGVVTITLPSSPSAGDVIAFKDYANTWDTNKVVLGRNGSKINGVCGCANLSVESQSVTIIYVDGTKGWIDIQDSTSNVTGTVPYNVQYLVVAGAGGGAAGTYGGGGGGAGGYRTLCSKTFPVDGTVNFPITVGAGGVGIQNPPTTTIVTGSPSIFSTITSAGGGGGTTSGAPGEANDATSGATGGSGGGTGGGGSPDDANTNYSGNTPPVSPPQGNPGGNGLVTSGNVRSGGGGGASCAGGNGAPLGPNIGANGGSGSPNAIFGSLPQAPTYGTGGPNPGRYFAGGGAGRGGFPPSPGTGGTGGAGGGGAGNPSGTGTVNTGGGGGGGQTGSSGASGGSGIVVIRHATSDATPVASGGNVVLTCGSDTVRIFTSDGTFTA